MKMLLLLLLPCLALADNLSVLDDPKGSQFFKSAYDSNDIPGSGRYDPYVLRHFPPQMADSLSQNQVNELRRYEQNRGPLRNTLRNTARRGIKCRTSYLKR